MKVVPEAHSVH